MYGVTIYEIVVIAATVSNPDFYTGCTPHVQRPQIPWGHRDLEIRPLWHTLHFGYVSTACTTKTSRVCPLLAFLPKAYDG